jgi:hypothetical protein
MAAGYIRRMKWPGQSLNLNPVENLWFKFGYEILKTSSNYHELIDEVLFYLLHIFTVKVVLKLADAADMQRRH